MAQTFTLSDSNRDEVFAACTSVINGYKVIRFKRKHKDGFCAMQVRMVEQPEHGATIYADDWNFHYHDKECIQDKPTYRIQTTSYGALAIPEIEKVIQKLQVAIATVKELESFDWDNAYIIEFEQDC